MADEKKPRVIPGMSPMNIPQNPGRGNGDTARQETKRKWNFKTHKVEEEAPLSPEQVHELPSPLPSARRKDDGSGPDWHGIPDKENRNN